MTEEAPELDPITDLLDAVFHLIKAASRLTDYPRDKKGYLPRDFRRGVAALLEQASELRPTLIELEDR